MYGSTEVINVHVVNYDTTINVLVLGGIKLILDLF